MALATGLAYVILAARERVSCWVFGIISCAFIAWDDFTNFKLYADGVLQLTYIAMGVVGLLRWLSKRDDVAEITIGKRSVKFHSLAMAIVLLLSLPIGHLLREYSVASFGYLDTVTTLMSLYATWLLINKVIENWLFWIAIDVVYVYLFYNTGGTIIAVLYAVFMIVAIYGYLEWRAKLKKQLLIETLSK